MFELNLKILSHLLVKHLNHPAHLLNELYMIKILFLHLEQSNCWIIKYVQLRNIETCI